MDEKLYYIALTLAKDIGPLNSLKLLERFGSASRIFRADRDELLSVQGIGVERVRAIKEFKAWYKVEEIIKTCEKKGFKIITIQDENYPERLKGISDPPIVLYIKGEIREDDLTSIAVVGTRRPTEYGIRVTKMLTGALAEAGLTIISGLARGIDTEAHKTALLKGGRTIAVLGSGLDVPYPPENRGLMKKIENSGAVITEFPPGTLPDRGNFPMRNRIISGLSLGVLVIEASSNSGSLITARQALEQGREVFAVPGSITSSNTKGGHILIRQGAVLVETAEDIIRELSPHLKDALERRKRTLPELSMDEQKVLKLLTTEPIHIDDLTRKSPFPLNKLLGLLTTLELKGVVRQTTGKRFYLAEEL